MLEWTCCKFGLRHQRVVELWVLDMLRRINSTDYGRKYFVGNEHG
jgi:hypothetical protein